MGFRAIPRESYLFSRSYILPTSAPFFCMLTSVEIRSLGMVSNKGHLNRYRCSNLLLLYSFRLNHNFVCLFWSYWDLLIDALDGRKADRPVLPSETPCQFFDLHEGSPSLPWPAPSRCHGTPSWSMVSFDLLIVMTSDEGLRHAPNPTIGPKTRQSHQASSPQC